MDTVNVLLSTGAEIHTSLQRRLLKTQAAMKVTANKHRRNVQFAARE